MVCGIGGWVDGGESATGSIRYLLRKLEAKRFALIPIDKFHLFQVPGQLSLRPHVRIEDGILKEHRFPQNQFFYSVNPNTDKDLTLLLGTEPNLNWEEYADAILGVAGEFETKLGFMASHNPKFQAYVEELEKNFIEVKYEDPLDISANEAVEIAEEFLRKKKED